MDKFDFNGKKVLVTGASSGVGREVAILLSAMGAKVVIVARRESELQKTLSLMEGSGHSYRVLDLTDFDGIVETVKDIIAKDGEKLDYIAHCAGLAVPIPLRSMSLANISQIFSSKTEMLANQAIKAIEGDAINELPDYLMLPDKIASIVVALLSDSMQYISGVAIDVDEAKTWED